MSRHRKAGDYRTNPFTGQRERINTFGFGTNSFQQRIRHSSRRSPYSKPVKLNKHQQKAAENFIIFCAVAFLIYLILQWMATHILAAIIILALLSGAFFLLYSKVSSFRNFFTKRFRTFGNVKDEEVKALIEVIKSIKTQRVRNEEDFEKQLFQRLDAKGYDVQRQVQKGEGKRIDLIVNSKIGIELKIAERTKNVQDLIGQVTVYKTYCEHIIVVILDIGIVQGLPEYIQMIENVSPEKIAVVVVQGDVRRYQKKEEYIMVKKTTSFE